MHIEGQVEVKDQGSDIFGATHISIYQISPGVPSGYGYFMQN